jgi:flagellar hook-length control protein FliK
MNNGNLLNTLMGATGANTAAAKTNAAKARAETGEKFQQALEQARPEVAARKPIARKESTPAERPASKTANQRPAQQETHRAESTKKTSVADQKVADSTVKIDSPSRDLKTDQPTDAPRDDSQDAAVAHCSELKEPTDVVTENLLLVDPGIVISDELSELSLSAEAVPEFSVDALLTSDSADERLINVETNVDPLLQDASLLAGVLPVTPTIIPEGESVELSPLVASIQAAGLSQPIAGLSASAQSAAAQASTAQATNGLTSSNSLGDLSIDTLTADTATSESETAIDIDAGENPDFLLLNSKAALNKLAESTMAAATLDKTAPAADLTKPAAATAAIETLTRLAEAQSPAARGFVVQTGVPVTVGSPQWSQAVGDKVLWLAAQNVSSAEIRLDPPELGPMQVKVSVNQDQANITFTSPHPVVRDALDQQLNRLREMFSEQGLNLVNVDVSDKSFAQQEREQSEGNRGQAGVEGDDEELAPVALTQIVSTRLVDHYA